MKTVQHTADTCPGRPCGSECDHVEFVQEPGEPSPGPWSISETRIIDRTGNTVVDCRGAMSGNDTAADKRLMAAAPELVDELYQLVESGIYADAASVSPWLRARRDEARALLARIKGVK